MDGLCTEVSDNVFGGQPEDPCQIEEILDVTIGEFALTFKFRFNSERDSGPDARAII